MVRLNDIGPLDIANAPAVSSLSFTTPADREYMIQRVLITGTSGDDNWTITVGGRQIARTRILAAGNNQLYGGVGGNYPRVRDLHTWYRHVYGENLNIPVPNGMTIVVASEGGATANITLVAVDMSRGSSNPAQANHYQGNRYIMPYCAYVAAAYTAVGRKAVDTEVKPAWVPSLMLGNPLPAGWRVSILALFHEALSVNTFSGAANHVSSTDHVEYTVNGELLFSHVLAGATTGPNAYVQTVAAGNLVTPQGIPIQSQAAAAGSGNTVYGLQANPFPAFQVMTDPYECVLDNPLVLTEGDWLQAQIDVTGDATGNPSFAPATIQALIEVLRTG